MSGVVYATVFGHAANFSAVVVMPWFPWATRNQSAAAHGRYKFKCGLILRVSGAQVANWKMRERRRSLI